MTRCGKLEVICGPMFSGKTTELIARLKAHAAAGRRVLAVKPARDTRYGMGVLVTHDGRSLGAAEMERGAELTQAMVGEDGVEVLGVDEAHFFGAELVGPCRELIARGVLVIIAGVERDHRGEPFEPFPALLCEADSVTKLSGPCAVCGGPAVHSQRMFANEDAIAVGGAGQYQARCRGCFGKQ